MRIRFSLRVLLTLAAAIAITVVCIDRWWNSRLIVLVDRYNSLIEHEKYDEATAVALNARRLYPDNDVAQHLFQQSEVIQHDRANAGAGGTSSPLTGDVCKYCGNHCRHPLKWSPAWTPQ